MTASEYAGIDTSVDANRTAVVGGGIVGCVVAMRLAAAGRQVSLYEASNSLGGLAAPWKLGSITWDRHYHVICESDTALRSLLQELGLEQDLIWSSVRTGFFSGGSLHEFTTVLDFLRFPPLRLHEKLRLGAAILIASRVDPTKLRGLTAARWLTRLCGRRVYSQIWEPLLRAKLGENAATVAASFIAVTIRRLFGARANASGAEKFGYVPGGYERILSTLQRKLESLGVEIHCGTPIDKMESDNSGVRLSMGEHRESFGHAIVTIPIPMIPALVPGLSVTERSRFLSIPYAGVICASLLVSKTLSPYYITNITDSWVPFSAIINFSNVTGTDPFDGKSLVYLPKYVAPDDQLFKQDDDAIRQSFVSALVRMIPDFDPADISAFKISRVRNVFPFPIASAPYERPGFGTSLSGISLATAAQIDDATLNVDRSVSLANEAARHVLKGARF